MDRIVQAVGWQPLGLVIDWAAVEDDFGVALPGDYKLLCETFGPGQFSGYLDLLHPDGGDSLVGCNSELRSIPRPSDFDPYAPYRIFMPGQGGLIQWGISVRGSSFFWDASNEDPGQWRVLAQPEYGGWSEFDFSMSEFLWKVVADVQLEEFSIGDLVDPPFFVPAAR
ncbi:SMI1/KNR4 family protein [Kitasatospora cathayae]|uniref:SMI1/KNR4 family protein n=1 Tax=Kitasatospora cathayae TaxID=3004092 RepID=A0ABY7QED3_9ACTN|nr:SMI1/KNR4 family protein [Kitasatospora sp. HUAS 3-15]WBP91113.1 SMI1/KNR4 family protein [Kitasatospora sp. HUAS 3-15]